MNISGILRFFHTSIRISLYLLCLLMMMSCAASLHPVTDSTILLERKGFTLLPPSGNNWLIGPSGPYGAQFAKQIVSSQGSKSTLVVLVYAGRFEGNVYDLKSDSGIKAAAEYVVTGADPSRFKVINATYSPIYKYQGTDCIKYEYTAEEHNNPIHRGNVLLLDVRGSLCRHPSAPDFSMNTAFSERRLIGMESLVDDHIREEVNHCLNSVHFTQLQ